MKKDGFTWLKVVYLSDEDNSENLIARVSRNRSSISLWFAKFAYLSVIIDREFPWVASGELAEFLILDLEFYRYLFFLRQTCI